MPSPLLLLLCFCSAVVSRTLLVRCGGDFIDVTVLLTERDFVGVVYTRPSRHTCSVWGSGEDSLHLSIPLSEPGMSDCGVALQNSYYTTVVDVRRNNLVEMADDSSFLIQCSTAQGSEHKRAPRIQTELKLLKDDVPVKEVVMGETYTAQVFLPSTNNYRVGTCVIFSGDDRIQIVPLTDDRGCPLSSAITPFRKVRGAGAVRAELTVFPLDNSAHFFLQCTVTKCDGQCSLPRCTEGTLADDLTSARVLAQNEQEAIAATRVVMLDPLLRRQVTKVKPCEFFTDAPSLLLSLLLGALVSSTAALFALAGNQPQFGGEWLSRLSCPADDEDDDDALAGDEKPSERLKIEPDTMCRASLLPSVNRLAANPAFTLTMTTAALTAAVQQIDCSQKATVVELVTPVKAHPSEDEESIDRVMEDGGGGQQPPPTPVKPARRNHEGRPPPPTPPPRGRRSTEGSPALGPPPPPPRTPSSAGISLDDDCFPPPPSVTTLSAVAAAHSGDTLDRRPTPQPLRRPSPPDRSSWYFDV